MLILRLISIRSNLHSSGEESHYTGYFDVVAIMNLLSYS